MIVLKANDSKGNEYPRITYMFYSIKDAKKRYRDQYGLKNKRLQWL